MKKKYLAITLSLALLGGACDQEMIELKDPCEVDPSSCETPPACPDGATAGTTSFGKFVVLGTSYSSGFQAGALFNNGQNTSLGKILATQFACAGGGTFNQPTINSDYGYNIFVSPNPPADNQVRGRYLLQGTPPTPSPYVFPLGNLSAAPSPIANPGFMYTGSAGAVPSNQLNNFSVQAVLLAQAVALTETGDWTKADMDPGTPGAQPHPYFNPFYARFASAPGTSTMLTDAIGSLTNNGTFFLYWLGMDDVLLYAAFGGDPTKAPLTPFEFVSPTNPGFKYLYNAGINALLANPSLEGVVANYPDIFTLPHFTSIKWNQIPLAQANVTALAELKGGYNAFLDGMVGATIITAEEAAKRKLDFVVGQNAILINDETLTDLSPYMAGPYAGLLPYARARQTKSTDIIPFGAGNVLGKEAAPNAVYGVSVPLADQYVLIPTEITAINQALTDFNGHIKSIADANPTRLAFADVNKALKDFTTAQVAIIDGVAITPGLAPPTGIYSEEGLHPNSRGYAFIANVFIDAINTKFGASVPKAKLSSYSGTSLPINP